MQRNKFLGVALAAGLAVATVSACGGGGSKTNNGLGIGGTSTTAGGGGSATSTSSGGSDPTGTVTGAFQKVGQNAGVQLVLSLEGSPSAFPASETATSTQLQAILNSQLIISAHTSNGKSLTQSSSSNGSSDFQIALVSGGANLGTIEILNGKTAYARVDINQTASTYGLDKGKAEQFQQELQQAGSAIPGLTALEAGQWVSLDLAPLLQLRQPSAATSTTTAGESPAMEQQLANDLINAFKQNSQITEIGSANGGTKYQAIIREKALVTSVGTALQSVPALGTKAGSINADNIPATQTLTVDVTVKDGTVSELQLPLNQFDMNHQLRGPLTLDLGISSADAISAPTGATPVDISNILSELKASGASSSSSS